VFVLFVTAKTSSISIYYAFRTHDLYHVWRCDLSSISPDSFCARCRDLYGPRAVSSAPDEANATGRHSFPAEPRETAPGGKFSYPTCRPRQTLYRNATRRRSHRSFCARIVKTCNPSRETNETRTTLSAHGVAPRTTHGRRGHRYTQYT